AAGPQSSPAPPRRSLHPAPPATARSTPASAAGPVRSSPENWPTPGCHPCLRCDMVSPRRFSFSMRLVPPDFTNRAGEPSLKPPTELETPSSLLNVPRFRPAVSAAPHPLCLSRILGSCLAAVNFLPCYILSSTAHVYGLLKTHSG